MQDTTVSASLGYGAADAWAAARRGAKFPDFYNEGSLIWLEADTIIRAQSNGTKSLDDFCRAFCGGRSGPPEVLTYTLDDVFLTLDRVTPFNWKTFFYDKLTALNEHAPLGGIEAAGWRLVYRDKQTALSEAYESQLRRLDMRYSFGALMDTDGTVIDVIPSTPAETAGLVPGMKVLGVNMRRFTPHRLREALREGANGSAYLQLLAAYRDDFVLLTIDHHAGERYPHLTRNEDIPDLLGAILTPISVR